MPLPPPKSLPKTLLTASLLFARMKFHEALRTGFYELQTARDVYRASVKSMNRRLIQRFMRVQLVLLNPIIPHYCEYIWRNLWTKHISVCRCILLYPRKNTLTILLRVSPFP